MNRPAILVADTVWHFYSDVIVPVTPIVFTLAALAAVIYEGNKAVGSAAALLLNFLMQA